MLFFSHRQPWRVPETGERSEGAEDQRHCAGDGRVVRLSVATVGSSSKRERTNPKMMNIHESFASSKVLRCCMLLLNADVMLLPLTQQQHTAVLVRASFVFLPPPRVSQLLFFAHCLSRAPGAAAFDSSTPKKKTHHPRQAWVATRKAVGGCGLIYGEVPSRSSGADADFGLGQAVVALAEERRAAVSKPRRHLWRRQGEF